MRAVSKISFRNFCIGRYTYHRRVYLMWLNLICTVFWNLIYFRRSVHTGFKAFRVPVNSLIRSVQFCTICNEMIFQSTSEARILFSTVKFSAIIIIVLWIEGLFLISVIFSLLFKSFLSWVWTSKLTSPWFRKEISLCISYLVVIIQVIILQGRLR